MRILVLTAGTAVEYPEKSAEEIMEFETLTQGKRIFKKVELLNNLQTIAALEKTKGITYLETVCFSERKNPVHLLRAGFAINRKLKKGHFNALYVFWGGVSGWVATLASPVPVIVALMGSDLQGSYNQFGKKTFFGKLLSFFSQLAATQAAGIVVMSEKMKERIHPKNQPKVLVLPEGVNLQHFYPLDKMECRKKIGWPADAPIVIFFYRGAFVKNSPLAFAAFELVKKEISNAELKVVDGVPNEELVYYYNSADLLLLTSFHEGSNNSLKEALACNCPVVSTNAGDAETRLAGVTQSYCVDEFTATSLAEKMLVVLKDGRRSNGSERVAEVSVENVAAKMSLFIQQVVENSRTQH